MEMNDKNVNISTDKLKPAYVITESMLKSFSNRPDNSIDSPVNEAEPS